MANNKDASNNEIVENNGKPNGTSQLPLFYKNPTPLDAKKHAELSLKKDFGFSFTKDINAVPINMVEMPQICHFYPIAFSPDENATPVAILGLRDNENLFLNADNSWDTDSYIPAYIRRYPFIFSEIPDSDQLTLCIDHTDETVETDGERRLFEKEGAPSELAKNALEFCKSYHAAAGQTLEFSKSIAEQGLLIEREAQINIAGNRRINFSGFRIIDEKKLSELDDKVFIEWRAKGWLPFLYAHLFSGAQWQRLTRLLNQRLEKEAA
ncbi:MAG: SapC family protein [Alphaproteobacteria bacterium]